VPSKKWNPWDFKQVKPTITQPTDRGLIAFCAQDSMIEHFFIERLKEDHRQRGVVTKILTGSELTKHWIEQELLQPSLFFQAETLVVLQAEMMSAEAKSTLSAGASLLSDRLVLLCSWKKPLSLDERLKGALSQDHILMLPPPWEMPKLLDYLASEVEYVLPPQVRHLVLDVVEAEVVSFTDALIKLKQASPDPLLLTVETAREWLSLSRMDPFEWGARFAKKDKHFFRDLELFDHDLGHFFRFMQNYIMKMIDHSYVDKKRAPSKYDREIMALSRQWRENELLSALHLFGELEVKAKRKDEMLLNDLRILNFQRY
jgi:DNA polymerase III delta subunit